MYIRYTQSDHYPTQINQHDTANQLQAFRKPFANKEFKDPSNVLDGARAPSTVLSIQAIAATEHG